MLDISELQHKNRGELIHLLTLSDEKIDSLEQQYLSKEKSIAEKEKRISLLEECIRYLKHERFGRSSEKCLANDPQYRLFDEAVMPNNASELEEAEETITIPAHQRKKPGRKPLSPDLPRKQIIYDLTDEEKLCPCGCTLVPIGEEITEQIDIVPAKIYVLQHVCKKYACSHCRETIKTAQKAKQPIANSVAAPGLLAHVITSKFQFHLPLYRQEQMLQTIGADVARNTLSLWIIKCSQLLQPLVNLLQDEILNYDVAYADESTLQVLKESDKAAESKSYMWAFGGGPPDRFSYLYQYHPSRKHDIAINFFQDYRGYLHCDGYQAYDALCRINPAVKQVGCWYHVRRKFVDASKVSKKKGMADWFIKQIRRLSQIEKVIQTEELSPEASRDYRQTHASVILDKIKGKLDELQDKTPAEGLLGKAIHYGLNQWPKLLTYLEDGRLEISNNRMERAIKPFTIGRKNWLFANSVDGAHAAANLFSLIETCKAHQVDPYEWLRETLTKIPACKTLEQYEALMPFYFKKLNPE